jgi:hypothetical protein
VPLSIIAAHREAARMHAGYRALLTWINVQDRAACDTRLSSSTCRAASSRELGLPAIVGTGDATRVLHDEQEVTVSCAEGDEGFVYDGCADYEVEDLDLANIPATRTQVMLNLANPAAAFRWWRIPADGARADGVRGQQPHQGPPDGAGELRWA